ncbi:MAG: CPBP family intramembrane metalloprotease [Chromatiales bacterium]|nr:CPBP family intramembrane metalloprotease [Chromatiales bacterium]
MVNNTQSQQMFGVTLLIGLNEELAFRGLIMTAFCIRFGLRNGALLSVVVFGAAHASNAVSSDNPLLSLLQVFVSAMTGSLLTLMALSMRSLWPAMLAHAIYDFAVMDMNAPGGGGWKRRVDGGTGGLRVPAGLHGVYRVFRLEGKEPYQD